MVIAKTTKIMIIRVITIIQEAPLKQQIMERDDDGCRKYTSCRESDNHIAGDVNGS